VKEIGNYHRKKGEFQRRTGKDEERFEHFCLTVGRIFEKNRSPPQLIRRERRGAKRKRVGAKAKKSRRLDLSNTVN